MMNSEKPSVETQELQQKAKLGSFNTQRAYLADWKLFENYCQSQGYESLPASAVVVANYLSSCKEYAWHTLQRKGKSVFKRTQQEQRLCFYFCS